MRKKGILFTFCMLLLGIAALFCSCGNDPGDVKLPDDKKVKDKIGSIIEDRFDDPVKVSESEKEAVWEVNLPDRNDLKVHFTFYKNGKAVGLGNGAVAYYNWELGCSTDYVMKIISAFDNSLKAYVDARYGMVPDSTEVSDRFDRPCVTVHCAKALDDVSEDDIIGYINECMKLYDIRAVQLDNYDCARGSCVETMTFVIVMDNVLFPDGTPFEYVITLDSLSLSTVKLATDGKNEYLNENWAHQQMTSKRSQYLHKFETANGSSAT